MVSKNEHTGQKQQTKVPSQQYKDNYDLIFGKKETKDRKVATPSPDQWHILHFGRALRAHQDAGGITVLSSPPKR